VTVLAALVACDLLSLVLFVAAGTTFYVTVTRDVTFAVAVVTCLLLSLVLLSLGAVAGIMVRLAAIVAATSHLFCRLKGLL